LGFLGVCGGPEEVVRRRRRRRGKDVTKQSPSWRRYVSGACGDKGAKLS